MSNTDPLKEFFDADEATQAPAIDIAFRLAVMEKVARRRFQTEVALYLGGMILVSICLALAWPGLEIAFLVLSQSLKDIVAMLTIMIVIAMAGQMVATHPKWLRLPR